MYLNSLVFHLHEFFLCINEVVSELYVFDDVNFCVLEYFCFECSVVLFVDDNVFECVGSPIVEYVEELFVCFVKSYASEFCGVVFDVE